MKKNKVCLEICKDERVYQFDCDPKSSLGEIYDVLCQMQYYILEKMQEAAPKKEQPKEKEKEDVKCS